MADLAAGRERYGLFDYPAHANIGDSAIWLGEVLLLRRQHGGPPAYVSHLRYPPAEARRILGEDALIYLHGGGNFGDLWNRHQDYRNQILSLYPGNRIVQLPQSIHFLRSEAIEPTRRAIASHRDYHLMVRDRPSLEFAQKHFDCPVHLAPDSAFAINAADLVRRLPSVSESSISGIALLRDDHERRPDALEGGRLFEESGWVRGDWKEVGPLRRWGQKAEMGVHSILSRPAFMALRERRFTAMATARVAMGLAQLDPGRVVVTDRLHGYILSTLLGKWQVVIDNSYGKLHNFIDSWGHSETTRLANGYKEGHRIAEALRAELTAAG